MTEQFLLSINGTIGNAAFYNSEKVVLGKSVCYFNLFQLMALCDTLESQIDEASNKQAALLNALMAQV